MALLSPILKVNGDLTVSSGANIWGYDGAALYVGGDLLLSGSISDNASGKISKLTVAGETVVDSAASISLSTANMTFTGDTEVDGTLQTTSGSITFTEASAATRIISSLILNGAASVTNSGTSSVYLGNVTCASDDVIFTGDFTVSENGTFSASSATTYQR